MMRILANPILLLQTSTFSSLHNSKPPVIHICTAAEVALLQRFHDVIFERFKSWIKYVVNVLQPNRLDLQRLGERAMKGTGGQQTVGIRIVN